ncbi:7516_t:CDS:2, partial [Dentiscutata heterogama]
MYHFANTIYCRLRWPGEPIKKLTTQEEKIHNSAKKYYIYEKPFGKEDKLKKFKLPIHFYNLENYLSLDIGNQRYMDSLQLIPGSLDSHISNLGAELCKEEVDKDRNSLNLPCKKSGHLYRIDSNRCFAHPERFPITREHGPKGRDDLVFCKGIFSYDWFNIPEKMDATSLPSIEEFN